MTRGQLMENLDSYELAEWEAFWLLEGGFGDSKQDRRMGQLCSILANVNRSKNRKNPFTIEDFDLRPKGFGVKKDNSAAIKAGFDALAAMG